VLTLVFAIVVASILGDQQAALFGQTAFEPGDAKNTYGTGLFLMLNTGTTPVPSKHGLLTTVAYQLGADGPVHYALEGSVSHAGATIQWLRDQLRIISSASESGALATPQNDGLYMVPAFGGLFAPHWRSNARACIVGMTASHHRGHVCRAALEAAAYQTREVFDAIVADSSVQLKSLKVDGGMTNNPIVMQFQADMLGVDVVQPVVMETTSMGAAFAAGLAVGVWTNLDEIKALWGVAKVYEPHMSEGDRAKNWAGWKKAVTRSWDWVEEEAVTAASDEEGEKFEDCLEFPDDRRTSSSWGSYVLSLIMVAGMAAVMGFAVGRTNVKRRS
jgi:glycerol kinase